MLGEREPPKKKEKKKKRKFLNQKKKLRKQKKVKMKEDPALDSLSQAIAFQQAKIEEEQKKWKPSSGGPSTSDDQDAQG